jgi:hypothetical protein
MGMVYLKLIGVYALATCAGLIFRKLGVPLPWMIGPLLTTAALFITGLTTRPVPVQSRPFGQMVVASTVGVGFTPEALRLVLDTAPVLIAMALITAGMALLVAVLLSRMSGLTLARALLATIPTSPVEAAVMAERFGFEPGPIVLSQTVRIAAVVVVVPVGIFIVHGWPAARLVATHGPMDPLGIVLLACCALIGGVLFKSLKLPNPYFLGPLAMSSALTAAGFGTAPYPPILLSIAQIVLGTWLGSTFRKKLFLEGGRLVVASIATTLLLLALSTAAAICLSGAVGLHWETLVLGAAPGGVTEMALTARFLGENVALITAFHLVRIFIFMPNIPWVIRAIHSHETRSR